MKYNAETNEFTFTRKERYEIYSLMLECVEEKMKDYLFTSSLCNVLVDVIQALYGFEYYSKIIYSPISERLKCLPELWAFNPHTYIWFKNNEERIAALKQCKKLTR